LETYHWEELSKHCLETYHWEELSKHFGYMLRPTPDLTFTKLCELGLHTGDNLEKIQEVSARAQKEHRFKRDLARMKTEWTPVCFELIAYRDSGAYVIRGVDEVLQ
ncbi:dynein heavy chain, partial [Kipferlia bialata]